MSDYAKHQTVYLGVLLAVAAVAMVVEALIHR
jgi:hypothetical protein